MSAQELDGHHQTLQKGLVCQLKNQTDTIKCYKKIQYVSSRTRSMLSKLLHVLLKMSTLYILLINMYIDCLVVFKGKI